VQEWGACEGYAEALRDAQDSLRRVEATVQAMAAVDTMRGPGADLIARRPNVNTIDRVAAALIPTEYDAAMPITRARDGHDRAG
jgi:hypothetical protein